jgi:hypothetical protein
LPAKDAYHDTVVTVLRKAGWSPITEQIALIIEDRRLWIDLRAVHAAEQRAILVEVKGFEHMASPVDYLAQATGKYVLYRAALAYLKLDLPLYMAVPDAAYHGILSEEIGQQTRQQNDIHLLVFNPEGEEITAWID